MLSERLELWRAGIRDYSVNSVDKTWITCCALCDMIIYSDSLSVEMEGEMGLHD